MHAVVLPRAPVDVLIADDDAQLRDSVRCFLEAEGFTCAEAADGRQAVAVAQRLTPRCVLLDLAMPELDGFDVARLLRADPRTAHSRVHCLSGHDDALSRRQAEQAGCELFLTKPVNPAMVAAAVRGWSGLSKSEAEDLLDWLQANGHPLAEITHEEGVGFGIRVPAPVPGVPQEQNATLDGEDRGPITRSAQSPVVGQLVRYVGELGPHWEADCIRVRLSRRSNLLPCGLGAMALLAAYWLGFFTFLEASAVAMLLVVLLAIPPEEWWLPSFPPSFQRDEHDGGGFLEFEGIVTERGRYGPNGMMRRRVEVVRVLRYDPRSA
jgi:CheY-like chemotaxis protein